MVRLGTSACALSIVTNMKSTVIFCLVFLYVRGDPSPSENFPHRESLDQDGSFILYWKTNTTHITFEVHAKTRGYVGFGISPNGKMYPSDVVVGWIAADGTPHFKVNIHCLLFKILKTKW